MGRCLSTEERLGRRDETADFEERPDGMMTLGATWTFVRKLLGPCTTKRREKLFVGVVEEKEDDRRTHINKPSCSIDHRMLVVVMNQIQYFTVMLKY